MVVCFVWAIQWYDICSGNMLVCFVWAVQWYDVCADNMFVCFVWAVQWYDVCAGNTLVCFVWAIQWYDVCAGNTVQWCTTCTKASSALHVAVASSWKKWSSTASILIGISDSTNVRRRLPKFPVSASGISNST